MVPVLTGSDHESKPVFEAVEPELGPIKDARRRQRRRWLATVLALAAAAWLLIVAFGGGGRTARPEASGSPSHSGLGSAKSPAAVFAQAPYLGVACHIANSIACDRVGLSVWLRRQAIVTATIAGATLKLNDPTWSYVAHSRHRILFVYAGFLQPAGLTTRLHVTPESDSSRWLGGNAPSPLVRFQIVYGPGDVVVTQEHVSLSAGWG